MEEIYCGQTQLPVEYKVGQGAKYGACRFASPPDSPETELSNPQPRKPTPRKPKAVKPGPSTSNPLTARVPKPNAQPNKSGKKEKSSPPNEASRPKDAPPRSNVCRPANLERPNEDPWDPNRESAKEEPRDRESLKRAFRKFEKPRLTLKEERDLGAFPEKGRLALDQPVEARLALGGRFELGENVDAGVLAREKRLWRDQLP